MKNIFPYLLAMAGATLMVATTKMLVGKRPVNTNGDLKERLETFYQKPIDEIYVESSQEVDTGKPTGKEIM